MTEERAALDAQKRHNMRFTQGPIDPLEAALLTLFEKYGIAFTRPERDPNDPANLDFYLPAYDLYVEAKQFHTPRISDQLAKVPVRSNALVLMGMKSVEAFADLVAALSHRAARG